jgi:hypothetical protein
LCCLFFWFIYNISSPPAQTPQEIARADKQSKEINKMQKLLDWGSIVTLTSDNGTVGVYTDKTSYDEASRFSTAQDTQGMMGLMLEGRVFQVEPGTQARLVRWEPDSGLCEVKIESGEHSGKHGLVLQANITPK